MIYLWQFNRLDQLIENLSKSYGNLKFLSLLGNHCCPDQLTMKDKDDDDYRRYRFEGRCPCSLISLIQQELHYLQAAKVTIPGFIANQVVGTKRCQTDRRME